MTDTSVMPLLSSDHALGGGEPADDARVYATPEHLDDFLSGTDPEPDYVIPGLLARHERLILTGPEGGGKSTLLRQLALMPAAGIHPFSGQPMPPIRVLLIDLENSRQQVRAKIGPIRETVGAVDLAVVVEPLGLDLTFLPDRTWLRDVVAEQDPDLTIIGPMYRLQGEDPMAEDVARIASRVLDHLRLQGDGCGLILEAHTPHTPAGARQIMRPYGASLWKRWPEFGLYLEADLEDPEKLAPLKPWRGGRDEREWPTVLRRSGHGTWEPFAAPTQPAGPTLLDKVVAELERSPEGLTQTALVSMVTGNKGAIEGAIRDGIHRGVLFRPADRQPIRLAKDLLDLGTGPTRKDRTGPEAVTP
jgi:replicative DNA helicase